MDGGRKEGREGDTCKREGGRKEGRKEGREGGREGGMDGGRKEKKPTNRQVGIPLSFMGILSCATELQVMACTS